MTGPEFRRLSLPASLASLKAFLDFAHAGADAAELSQADCIRLDLVLEELLVNVVRYAYHPGTGDVELSYALNPAGGLLLQLADNGRIFNPLDREGPALEDNLNARPIGGLGIFLVRQMVDSLTYRRQDGRNILSFLFPAASQPRT